MSHETAPRSLKGNLLNARDRLGETIIEIVVADVAEHGEEVIGALRRQNPAAYARLVSDLVHFKKLAAERAPKKNPGKPQRKPRETRIKDLLKAMEDQPIDPNNALLPLKHRERWLQAEEALLPRNSFNSPQRSCGRSGTRTSRPGSRRAAATATAQDRHPQGFGR